MSQAIKQAEQITPTGATIRRWYVWAPSRYIVWAPTAQAARERVEKTSRQVRRVAPAPGLIA